MAMFGAWVKVCQPGAVVAVLLLAACTAPAPGAPAGPPAATSAAPPAAQAAASPAAQTVASPAAADSGSTDSAVAAFYRGKTLRLRVGLAAGGGYDLYTRAISRHISAHLQGNPTAIVENVPGAGGTLLAADIYNRGAKDGTELGIWPGALFLQRILGDTSLGFNMQGWGFVGAPGISEYICESQDRSGITDWKQLMPPNARPTAFGAVAGSGEQQSLMIKDVFNLSNLRIVGGYAGTAPVRLAMEQGEVDGQCLNDWSSLVSNSLDDLKTGRQKILLQLTSYKKQGVPQGDAPTIYEFVSDDADKATIKVGIEDPGVYARAYVTPPGVPAERLAALRKAFDDTMTDPDFRDEAGKANLDISPKSGAELEQLIQNAEQTPDAIKARLRGYFKVGG
jgi:tripartite-type tricarboxylate transporter receptor subunit TctC